ncbi:EAL domain-containing protein [uncultured Pseudoteredinibacter sp.]|uniref:bifunctional diguanylate cyclase/phosphodiesterase n=1 Tax=uncultured Pseudoteredinibacter sp. TaxID=1641701 RepID=UPI00262B823C|nr:EAL domain-containing protein [uncultured Pseudoteredinibacter sp.]
MSQHTVKDILQSVSPGDQEFFPSIVKALAHALSADMVFIARIDNEENRSETLSVYSPNSDVDNFEYDLEHTPCCQVANSGNLVCTYNGDVQQHFPEDEMLVDMGINSYLGTPLKNAENEVIGILVAIFSGSIPDLKQSELMFNLFSGLVSRELVVVENMRQLSVANQVFSSLDEAIVIFDPEMKIRLVNRAYERISGYDHDELINKDIHSTEFLGRNQQLLYTITESMETVGSWVGEINGRRKDGVYYTVQVQITTSKDSRGYIENYIAVLSDITSKKHAEKTIHIQANYDSLTGLPNRQLFNDRLDQAIRISKRKNKKFAVVFMDIDMFKSINDSLGHSWGDVLLAEVSFRLKRALRASDTIARFGGDEFTFIVDPIEKVSDAIVVLDQIVKTMHEPFTLQSNRVFVTSSLGVALYPDDGLDREQLIAHADQAMYSAKNLGRDQYQFFTSDMHRAVEEKLAIKNALQEAIINRDIDVCFQWIKNESDPQQIKLEVLARWQHEGEQIPPDVFIAIAEEFNLISDLDDVILEKACFSGFQLCQMGIENFMLCTNRSPIELAKRGNPVQRWRNIIESYGLRVEQFNIEVTENILAKDSDGHFEVLYQLADAGFSISIDDFGTGYCSLGYLNKFPIDTIKIDKSFIDELGKNDQQSAIVDAIMAMAKALNKHVVAEGVECQQQYEALKRLGCMQYQGYMFSKPLSFEQLSGFLGNELLNLTVDSNR